MSSSGEENFFDSSEVVESEEDDESLDGNNQSEVDDSMNEDVESSSENEPESEKNSSDSVVEDVNSDSERTDIRGELKSMSFEELMKLKQKLGSKVYNEAIFGATKEKRSVKKLFKRENNNRPMEMSSKKQVPFGVSSKKKTKEVIADPRFNASCGDFDSTKFKKQYDFVNDMRERELKTLKTNLKKCDDPEESTQIKFLIQRLKNQLHEEKRRKEKLVKKYNQADETDKLKLENKKPFYVKPSLKKTEDMVKQYEELKKTGKLQKHLEKRRKKSLMKDRKKFNVH